METESEKIKALERVATALTTEGISWAVANGLESYPDGIGRDLDIIVSHGSLDKAVSAVVDSLEEQGWIVLPNRQGWIWWIVAFQQREDLGFNSLQIDLFEHLQWAFTWVVDGVGTDSSLIQRGPFLEDPGASVGKTFVLNALSKGAIGFSTKPKYLWLDAAQKEALPSLLKRISGREWSRIVADIERKDMAALGITLTALRKACSLQSFFAPGKMRRLHSAILKQWVVNLNPTQGAPVIEIGTTGSSDHKEILGAVVTEMRTLVFHSTKVIVGGKEPARRAARKLSCLQNVLVCDGAGTSARCGLIPDLVVIWRDGELILGAGQFETTAPTDPAGFLTAFRKCLYAALLSKSTSSDKIRFSKPPRLIKPNEPSK